jgi:hypothetical protein
MFQPGDHLRVRRRNIYSHHGIYVSDDRVIEFGGATFRSKGQAIIRPVTLREFAGSGNAVAVKHPNRTTLGMGLPGPLRRCEIVARAEWLIDHCPRGRYSLVGYNCEHVANWCVTGWYSESLQVRRVFLAQAMVLGALLLICRRSRPPWWLAALLGALSLVGPYKYNSDPVRLWKDVLDRWPRYRNHDASGN